MTTEQIYSLISHMANTLILCLSCFAIGFIQGRKSILKKIQKEVKNLKSAISEELLKAIKNSKIQ